MHGDGVTTRVVAWPVFVRDALVIRWVVARARRFRCPVCHANVRVAHPGVGRRSRYATAAICALLHLIGAEPFGEGLSEAEAFRRARGRVIGLSERGRSGRPRWSALRRWIRDLEKRWPALLLPHVGRVGRLHAALVSFGLGRPVQEVVHTAVVAHAGEGAAM